MVNSDFIDKLANEGLKGSFPAAHKVAVKWLFVMAGYFAILVAISGVRSDISVKLANPLYLIELGAMILTTIASTYAASCLALPDDNQKSWIRFTPFVPMMPLAGIICYGLCCTQTMPFIECLKMGRYDCIIHVALYSIIPVTFMFYTIQKAAPIKCCFAGAMAGLSAGSFGYVTLRLISDKSDDATSLLIWHFLPVIGVVLISMMFGKIFFGKIWRKNI